MGAGDGMEGGLSGRVRSGRSEMECRGGHEVCEKGKEASAKSEIEGARGIARMRWAELS